MISNQPRTLSKGPGRKAIIQMGPVARATMEFGIFVERAKHELGLAKYASNPFFKALHLRSARTAGAHARDWLAIAQKEASMESGVAA